MKTLMSTYNKENLLQHLVQLTPDEYNIDEDGFYIRDYTDRKIEINYSYEEYFPFSVIYLGLSMDIRFNRVEEIMHEVANNVGFNIKRVTTSNTFNLGFREDVLGQTDTNKMYNIEVEDDISFSRVRPFLEQLMTASQSFLVQHQTLADFYNYGETLTPRDQAFFYNTPPASMLIVRKLVGQPYDALASEVITGLNADGETDDANFIQALKNHLDSL